MQAAARGAEEVQAGVHQRMESELAPVRSERQSRVAELRAEAEELRKRFSQCDAGCNVSAASELPAIARRGARVSGPAEGG